MREQALAHRGYGWRHMLRSYNGATAPAIETAGSLELAAAQAYRRRRHQRSECGAKMASDLQAARRHVAKSKSIKPYKILAKQREQRHNGNISTA